MSDTDKEPKIIVDDALMEGDTSQMTNDLGEQSFGEDIIDGDDWDVDDFDGEFDSMDEEEVMGNQDDSPSNSGKKWLIYGVLGLVTVGAGGFLFTQMNTTTNGRDLMLVQGDTGPVNPVSALSETPDATVEGTVSGAIALDRTNDNDAGMLSDLSSIDNLIASVEEDETPSPTDRTEELDDIFAALDTDPQEIPMPITDADASSSELDDSIPMPSAITSDLSEPEVFETVETMDSPTYAGEPLMDEIDLAELDSPLTPMPQAAREEANPMAEPDMMPAQQTALPEQPVVPASTPETDEKLLVLEQRITALTGNLESLAMAVETIARTRQQPTQQAANVDAGLVADLEKTIARLEQRVEDLSRQNRTATTPATASQPRTTGTPNRTATRANTVSTSWVLRGAMPGEAVVSRTSDGSVLTIKTGESLSGLGKIRSISKENGKWVVQGSRGKIVH